MSRVGMLPVEVPDGVDLQIDGGAVKAKGKLGELSLSVSDDVQVSLEKNLIWVKPANNSKRARTMWGTTRSLLNNIVYGVSAGFEKKLEITGVGYRAQVQGKNLVLQLGHSHEIRYPIPDGIKIDAPSQTEVVVSGIDNQKVARSPRKSGVSANPNLTRVKACGMRTRSLSARKVRRSNHGWYIETGTAPPRPCAPADPQSANGRPRLSVFRSNKYIYAQVIDDLSGKTVAAASSREDSVAAGANQEAAAEVGKLVAKRANEQGVKAVVFDRGPYLYHRPRQGACRSAREGGLAF